MKIALIITSFIFLSAFDYDCVENNRSISSAKIYSDCVDDAIRYTPEYKRDSESEKMGIINDCGNKARYDSLDLRNCKREIEDGR